MQAMGLPQLDGHVFLTDGGVETDLIFHRGMDLPEFASFVLHENAESEAVLRDYYAEYLAIGATTGLGLVLETSTWRASKDCGSKLGYDAGQLRAANERSVQFFREMCASDAD